MSFQLSPPSPPPTLATIKVRMERGFPRKWPHKRREKQREGEGENYLAFAEIAGVFERITQGNCQVSTSVHTLVLSLCIGFFAVEGECVGGELHRCSAV